MYVYKYYSSPSCPLVTLPPRSFNSLLANSSCTLYHALASGSFVVSMQSDMPAIFLVMKGGQYFLPSSSRLSARIGLSMCVLYIYKDAVQFLNALSHMLLSFAYFVLLFQDFSRFAMWFFFCTMFRLVLVLFAFLSLISLTAFRPMSGINTHGGLFGNADMSIWYSFILYTHLSKYSCPFVS